MISKKNNQPDSFLLAVFNHKCPRCRQGNMYKTSALNLSKYASMHTNCEHCNLKFEVEPGFFYGAMFVSYVISVSFIGMSFISIYWLLNNPSMTVYISIICGVIVLTMPLNFRYARTLMLHIFGGVDFVREKYVS